MPAKNDRKRGLIIILILFLYFSEISYFIVENSGINFMNKNINKDKNSFHSDFPPDNKIEDFLRTSVRYEWNKTFDYGLNETGNAIATDNNGNLIVVGTLINRTKKNDTDAFAAKFYPNGTLIWLRTIGGNFSEEFFDLVLDNAGNIFAVGYIENRTNSNDYDVLIVKISASGDYIWNRTWGYGGIDKGLAISADLKGNIYIVGYSEQENTSEDVLILKYNSSGYLNWTKIWGGIFDDEALDIILDDSENIYITGTTSSFGPSGINLLFMKYNKSGSLLWNATWGGAMPDIGRNILYISQNEIFTIGSTASYGSGGFDIAVIKWNSSGSVIGQFIIGGSNDDKGYSSTLYYDNNIIICGSTKSYSESNGDLWILKINRTFSLLWNVTWGGNQFDCGYDVIFGNSSALYFTGRTESFGDISGDILLVKMNPKPSPFLLKSDADNPDPDGDFVLIWTESYDFENYSLYQYDKPITEINNSISKILEGAINNSFRITNLSEGIYYYIAVAFNKFGNSTSNCIKVIVFYPPGGFSLNSNAGNPDKDGNFILNWTSSKNADNYSIYVSNSYITEINSSCSLIIDGLPKTKNNYTISNVFTGDYYYIIVAENIAGINMSNCLHITVGRVPLPFYLYSDVQNIDNDGEFNLIWTPSNFSYNYSILYSESTTWDTYSIYKEGLVPIKDWTEAENYSYLIKGLESGTYYFKIFAYNKFGYNVSNMIEMKVLLPEENTGGNGDEQPASSENNLNDIMIGTIVMTLGFLALISGLIILVKIRNRKF
ncbi:MAG: hypothetical protein ACTSQS_15230 [Promethearchaeota archaeon]